MSNQAFYIPSGGVGETEYDIDKNNLFTAEASRFSKIKKYLF